MVLVTNTPYTVAIDEIVDFENIEQRAQVQHGTRVYDINWDSANERVVAYYTEEDQPLWFEIRHDDTAPKDITLYDVLTAFGCASEDTVPIIVSPFTQFFAVGYYLAAPISTEFLVQMSIEPVEDDNLDPNGDDDPSASSSEFEPMEEDDDILPEAGLVISVGDDDPVIEVIN